jgi:hypothetical protein
MSRPIKQLGAIADAMLAEVEQAQVVKTAAAAHTSVVTSPIGQQLLKTAALVRQAASAEITYDDLARFRKKYDL